MPAPVGLTKTWSYLAATTFERVSSFIADNVTGRIFLLHVLDQSGMRQRINGGLNLVLRVLQEVPAGVDYTDLDPLQPSRANPLNVAVYNWKQVAVPVQISGRDMLINSGSDVAITSILTLFIEAAELGMRDRLGGSSGIFSTNDEAAAGITGTRNLFATTGTGTGNISPTTGTAGNLSRATYTFWRNFGRDVQSAFGTNGLTRMNQLYLDCSRGDETPDIVILTRTAFELFIRNAGAQGSIRYNLPLTGGVQNLAFGWSSVTYFDAILGHDDGVPAETGYMLNSKYMHWMVHALRELELGPMAYTPTLDALSGWLMFAGNLGVSNMARHGVLINTDTN